MSWPSPDRQCGTVASVKRFRFVIIYLEFWIDSPRALVHSKAEQSQ